MNKLKSLLTSALLLNIVFLDSGSVSAFSQAEADAIKAVDIRQCEDINLRIETGTDVFKGLGLPSATALSYAEEFVLRAGGLGTLNRIARSSATVTVIGPDKFDIKLTKHHDPAVRIYFELMHTLGFYDPTRTWSPADVLAETSLRTIKPWLPMDTKKNIYDWVLEQTQTLMEILGDSARVIPGVTIRGGVSARADKTSVTPIIAKMLTTKEKVTVERINHELNDLLDNALTFKWFASLGSDKEKRATFIALCVDLSMGGIALTDEEFKTNYNFAQTLALAKLAK